ncbi:MAG TPA: hypothetical protein VEX37_16205 [Thermomicrobiales bacterium]|nr:hypothetical protein [Thermomicrobiales bacterium]
MQPELEHEVVVLGATDPWRATGQWFGGQIAGRVPLEIAVDGAAVDPKQRRHLGLWTARVNGGNDALAQIQALGAHAASSFPEPVSIPPAQSHCKPL